MAESDDRKMDGPFGVSGINPAQCMRCLNAEGLPPFADSPLKSYCLAYPREEGRRKPADVYYEGAECPLFRPRTR